MKLKKWVVDDGLTVHFFMFHANAEKFCRVIHADPYNDLWKM